ncbi:hypothetical protein [Terriglobus roseus]|uniref:Uncharacterized protein n=1 Tax=Terriglobus roseus TaxID=392734 RepID=A0A1H4ITX2_9BACT|nr:hypothetical protein [Terriglobus roseus]SEB37561.1 hypothetical protein SAMN05443244_0079 [Terriglobus roseus]
MAKFARTFTVAFTLMASALFQSGRTVSSAPKESPTPKTTPVSAKGIPGQQVMGEGPWIASCRYWAAVYRPEITKANPSATTDAAVSSMPTAGCGSPEGVGWNIPRDDAKAGNTAASPASDITSLIAVVPDPVHSGLSLDFDRTLESVLLAAADGHYLSDYYWLPWQHRSESASSAAPSDERDSQRERLPGLIILRYVPETKQWPRKEKRASPLKTGGPVARATADDSWKSYRKVVYLFLVAETPALGINGEQLQNALRFEAYLRNRHHAHLSLQHDGVDSTAPLETAETPRFDRLTGRVHSRLSSRAPLGGTTEVRNSDNEKTTREGKTAEVLSVIGPSYSGTAASLYAGLTASLPEMGNPTLSVIGVTSTAIASHALDPNGQGSYRSFGENTGFEQDRFLEALVRSGFDLSRVAVLSEAGTVFGSTSGETASSASTKTSGREGDRNECPTGERGCYRPGDKPLNSVGTILNLRFPRELSVVRNAMASEVKGGAPTPYLGFSLKGDAADDTVEHFSTTQTPLSIEAQLMAIANQLKRARTQFVLISASNILDDVFLADFLHRACPDARIVTSSGGDLLFEREGENASYVGSLSLSPYLLSSLDFTRRTQWLHSDYHSAEMYNAASFAFRNSTSRSEPVLSGYLRRSKSLADGKTLVSQIPLWASAIGADGYYPLGLLSWCGSDSSTILPSISLDPKAGAAPALALCTEDDVLPRKANAELNDTQVRVPESINSNSGIVPGLPWQILAGVLCVACLIHTVGLLVADLWSPFTRDVAIDQNDSPHRRAVYINIGGSVLAAMAFVVAYPLLRVSHYFHVTPGSLSVAAVLMCCAAFVCVSTAWKTRRYFYHPKCRPYTFFNFVAVLALAGIVLLWARICSSDTLYGYPNFAGLYHSFRCLQPFSGVSPICPVVLVLFAWYLWAIYQTARLRFSHIHRPRLPRKVPDGANHEASPMFVPDDVLEACETPRSTCLYADMTSLLITREIAARFLSKSFHRWLDTALGCVYVVLFLGCLVLFRIHGLDRFVFRPVLFSWGPTLYEALLKALFFPLLMVALSGWLRVLFVWTALNRGLLEPLERMPIRFAFDRYKSGGWMSMLRQKGLHIRWREMSRSTETIRQIVRHPELAQDPQLQSELLAQHQIINLQIHNLMKSIGSGKRSASGLIPASAAAVDVEEQSCPSEQLWDMPKDCADTCSIFHIESGYAEFSTLLVGRYLMERWGKRVGGVNDPAPTTKQDKANTDEGVTAPVSLEQLAEDLIVIRYVALIRAVLLNIRYQMLIVGNTFVLALIAWNSFPFEPHAFMDWGFTFLLGALSVGFIGVFAQMHRSAILSRITDTTPNELGSDFYLRIATFGAVPLLTWIAYEFPQIGGTVYKLLQPGLQGMK